MSPSPARHRRLLVLPAIAATMAAVLSACSSSSSGSGDTPSAASSAGASSGSYASLQQMVPGSYKSAGTIHLATDFAEPPLMFAKGTSQPGLVFSVTEEAAKRLGLTVTPVLIADSSTWPTALSAKRVDMLPTFNDTTERQQAGYTFVDWAYNSIVFDVPKGNPKKITGWDSVCGRTIGMIAGTTQVAITNAESARCVADGDPKINVRTYSGGTQTLAALQSGQIDAQIGSGLSSPYAAEHGASYEVVSNFQTYAQNMGFGFRKDDAALADALAASLNSMIKDGTYQKLFQQYGLSSSAKTSVTRDKAASAVPSVAPSPAPSVLTAG
ncbi:putative secreted protein [Actinacidiphila reveromycinica]|uniref:Putative secreted protein n=1 Tax=Actinacidiphila reveromycinica TaxID=659352 RepID=A0A7U3UMV4_9ACTN|nr:transporter substrate-binding domain-containing protein [Streptomyces sp. SN-593]BBA95483.1 putative secreted protein [Streptomyces sp. SN-593]